MAYVFPSSRSPNMAIDTDAQGRPAPCGRFPWAPVISTLGLIMPLTFTLDTNCIIAVDETRPEGAFISELAEAHQAGIASVGIVAISASERQKADGSIENFVEFTDRLNRLGLGHLEILEPMMYWDVTFWDHGLWSDEQMEDLERRIHEVLFPNIEFNWVDFCTARGLDPKADHPDKKWRNAKCDVQAFWSHAYRKRDVFVTSDKNFHTDSRKSRLLSIAGGRIELPESGAAILRHTQ